MPKRKRDKFGDSDYKCLTKKLKKLERKIERRRRRRHSDTSSSDCDDPMPRNQQESDIIAVEDDVVLGVDDDVVSIHNNYMSLPGCSHWPDDNLYEHVPGPTVHVDTGAQLTSPLNVPSATAVVSVAPAAANSLLRDAVSPLSPVVATATTQPPPPASTEVLTEVPQPSLLQALNNPAVSQEEVLVLDPDLIEILGEDPTSTKEFGRDIQKDLAIRFNHITTSGLSKENRKDLREKYLIPANCKLIKAPTLNPEIRASLVESQAKRDKGIENKQILTSCALSSLGEAITLLLSSKNKNPELLKLLMDTARILSDIQHADSISRRFFILSTVKKELKDQLEKTKIDEMLFSSNLPEILKSAKTINKSGAELRSVSTMKPVTQKTGKAPIRPLNYRAPPAHRRPPPPGGARTTRAPPPYPTPRQMTTPATQHNASRTSLRQPPPRHRR